MSTPVTLDALVEKISPIFEKRTVELVAAVEEKHQKALAEQNDRHAAEIETLNAGGVSMRELLDSVKQTAHNTQKTVAPGIGAAQFVRAFAAAKGDTDRAAKIAGQWYGSDHPVTKALVTNDLAAGGAIVPEEYRAEIIELLRAESVIRRLGPVTLPMVNGVLSIPKLTGGSSAGYVGESEASNATAPTFGNLKLSWKKLRALVPMSNELVRFSNPSADAVVRDDLVQGMATTADVAFIRGDGTNDQPRGLRYWAPSANQIASDAANDGSVPTLGEVESDFRELLQALEGANVRMLKPAWLMAPRSKNFLMTLRDSNGNLAFPEMRIMNPTLWGRPVGVTNNIPTNLASGTNGESEIYLVDFADAVIGEATTLEIAISTEASYTDSSGTVRGAFDRDETVIRVIERHDFGMRHDASVAVKTGVVYGTGS